ncbi:hypothetical protein BC940DRAFT_301530 [Gongronella butleri]|nr:hypothetical protein BC940DRAFT_301530 [Gongronella butleri]
MTSISISTKTVTGLAETGFESASVFLGFYFDVNEKHRTTSEYGPEPKFDHRFTLPVPAGFSILHVELVNESAAQPQVIGQGSIDYREIREKDTFVPLMATDGSNRVISQAILSVQQMTSRPAGQEEVPPSLPSIDTSVGDVLPPPPPYDGPMVDFPSEKAGSGPGAFQRQDSLASLGPEVPMPEGYGRGAPPPFQPPGQRGVSPTPSAPASSSVNPAAQGSSQNTEEAQRGTDWKVELVKNDEIHPLMSFFSHFSHCFIRRLVV